MGVRGRTSSAALSVRRSVDVQEICRPDAPYDLTDEQAEEWRAVVDRMPADWFPRETWGMLTAYCRHVVSQRKVAQMIQALEGEMQAEVDAGTPRSEVLLSSSKSLDRLFKMQEREGRAISLLATRMRLSQQSSYDKSRKKGSPAKRPWEE